MRIVWSPTARRRTAEAIEFIARDRPLAALDWYEGLVQRIELLRELVRRGEELPDEMLESALRRLMDRLTE